MVFHFDEKGLAPAIVQDARSGEVLMLAYVNAEAVKRMFAEGVTYFYSRSRNKLWKKGESSGHLQKVKEVLTDCDQDALLIKVEQVGGACHLGYRTCFVHQVDQTGKIVAVTQEKVFDPERAYKNSGGSSAKGHGSPT